MADKYAVLVRHSNPSTGLGVCGVAVPSYSYPMPEFCSLEEAERVACKMAADSSCIYYVVKLVGTAKTVKTIKVMAEVE